MRPQEAMLEKALRAADPLAGREEASAPENAERLLASIVGADPDDGGSQVTRAAHRPLIGRRRRYLLAAPLVAILVAILVAGLPGGSKTGRSTLPALARVAQAAAAQAPLDSDLPYVYMKTQSTYTATSVAGGRSWSVQMPTTQEEWIARDGSGRVRTISGPPSWVSTADREAWEAAGRISFLAHGWGRHIDEESVPPGYFRNAAPDGTPLSELPTDATALSAWLEHVVHDPATGADAGNGFSAAVRTLTVAAEILNDPLASPELRAALYEAEGLVPGVEYLGQATDQAGRRGIAVGAESANSGAPTVYSLVFDPKTSKVLATQQTILEAPTALPDEGYPRTESTLYLESGATRSLGRKPTDPR